MDFLQLLKGIGPILVVVTFIKTAYEFIKGLKWKKSEYLSKEVKEFFSDQNVKTVCVLLDYNVRKIDLLGNKIVVSDSDLIEALKTHQVKQSFTTEQAALRDIFDLFFDKLSYFNIHIKNGLVEKKQVLLYLNYYLDIIAKPGRKPNELVQVFNDYIDYYGYTNVRELLDMHKKSPKRTFYNKVIRFFS